MALEVVIANDPRGRPREKRPHHRQQHLPAREQTHDEQAYYVKRRGWRDMIDAEPVTFANGRAALQGTCPVCPRKLARIVEGSGTARYLVPWPVHLRS
jgi:hypothetical protein